MAWCTIESDPGVFSELIEQGLGVQDVGVEEIYSLDSLLPSTAQDSPQTSYGLIFLFKWINEPDPRPTIDPNELPELFFAKQVVTNACATQAILSVLLNNAESLNLSETLMNLRSFTMMIDSESKGIAIGNSDEIRLAHNSFARPEPIIHEESKSRKKSSEDAYHFIAYIPFQSHVYEIDGLKSGPIDLGEIADGYWLNVAKPAIEARMNRYSASETHFALLSVCPKRLSVLSNQMQDLEKALATPSDQDERALTELERLRYEYSEELMRLEKRRVENVRRRHNYIPLAITLIRALAAKGKLQGLRVAAVERKAVSKR